MLVLKGRVKRCVAAVLLLGLYGAHALAAPIQFTRNQVAYDLKGESLKEFLTRFFAEQGLQVVLSPLVESQGGTLNGPRSGSAEQVFRSIASANQLTAYYDGGAVYIYKLNERMTRYLAVPSSRVEAGQNVAISAVVEDVERLRLARIDEGGVVQQIAHPHHQVAAIGAVQRAGNRIPNYRETQHYVKTVLQLYDMLKPAAVAAAGTRAPRRVRMELPGVTTATATNAATTAKPPSSFRRRAGSTASHSTSSPPTRAQLLARIWAGWSTRTPYANHAAADKQLICQDRTLSPVASRVRRSSAICGMAMKQPSTAAV